MQLFRKVIKKMVGNVTSDVYNTILNSLWRIISGPLTILIVIPLFISEVTQGYWYTFLSMAALSIFADLGFTTIIAQFSAHEYAHLGFDKGGYLEGENDHLYRLGSLLKFTVKWALTASIIAFPIILAVGFVLFSVSNESVTWIVPWILYVISSGLSFIIGVILSFYEGCNQISDIQKMRFISSMVQTIATWLFLCLKFGLYTLSISAILASFVGLMLFLRKYKKSVMQLLKIPKNYYYNWKPEFMSLLWRYAISFSSGYFIFQIYTPLSKLYFGTIFAGKVGISMSLCGAVFTIANVWIYTSTPRINMHASLKLWSDMDKSSVKSIGLSALTFILGAGSILAFIYIFNGRINLLNRFLGIIPMSMLLISWFLQIFVNGMAIYLRAHKREPLVVLSLIVGIYIALSTILIAKFMSSDYLFLGFLSSFIFALPTCAYILIKKRNEWHKGTNDELRNIALP